MAIFERIIELVSGTASSALSAIVEAVRTAFEGDPETRRKVAFSVAMIALSAKMAKADGIVTEDEINAFRDIFHFPDDEAANVSRLYNLARQDVAGFEAYATRMAGMCGSGAPNCIYLEDIIDGLFHIAKADGVVHEAELSFLRRVGEIFGFDAVHFDRIMARHVKGGKGDPYAVLGVSPHDDLEAIRKAWRRLAAENHPDRVMAHGLPAEFAAIAEERIRAINAAWDEIEKRHRAVRSERAEA